MFDITETPPTEDMTSWQTAAPTSGQTVTSDGSPNLALIHPALLAALTVVFPPALRDGQVFRITPRAPVTLLTLNTPDSKPLIGTVGALNLGGPSLQWVYLKAIDSWLRF